MTGPAKIDHLSAKITDFFIFALSKLHNYSYYCNKIFVITVEFNELSSVGRYLPVCHR